MVVLGSTGSIGVNTLEVAKRFNIRVEALVAGNNIELLKKQILEFRPSFVCVASKSLAKLIDHPRVFWGEDGILEVIRHSNSSIVVNALVGFLGLRPTIEAIKEKKTVALANKESLVVAGAFIDPKYLRPIDSEHFALWYLLSDKKPKKMIITASGGAFRDAPLKKIENATLEDALKHPNWSMGTKITIDSATMTNKLFEFIEAKWFYDCEDIDAVIEPKSIIHAFVEFADGVTTAQMAHPDMKLPIAYAILQKVDTPILKPINLLEIESIEFRKIDLKRYPVWEIKDDLLKHPKRGVVVNAANEVAISLFSNKKIRFNQIANLTIKAYEYFNSIDPKSIDEVFEIDREVRSWCKKVYKNNDFKY